MFVSRRSEPPEDSCSHCTVPRPAGKALPQGRCDVGHGVPAPPQPATGAARHPPFATLRCRLGSAVRRSSESPRGAGDEASQGEQRWRALLRRVPPTLDPRSRCGHREPQTPVTRGSSSPLEAPPAKLIVPSRAGSPRRPPPTAPGGCPSLTWRLPGRSLTASGGGARRSRGCLCRHLHGPLPR